jgi:hypothetical protein
MFKFHFFFGGGGPRFLRFAVKVVFFAVLSILSYFVAVLVGCLEISLILLSAFSFLSKDSYLSASAEALAN